MKDNSSSFLFQLSKPLDDASAIAQTTVHLAEIAARLALEERTLVVHPTGRPENVAEHSNMLAIVGPALAEEYYPDLDAGLVARYAPVHDIVEAYVGDTPTHDISEAGLVSKEEREKQGLAKLKADFAWLPHFAQLVESYEAQKIPEARFVRVCDKLMPLLVHFVEQGKTLRAYITAEPLLQNSAERAAALRHDYPEFETIIALREELAALAVRELL
jgi:5'-deoxynucleotidase YfbR-like HD superfamily hydrolase